MNIYVGNLSLKVTEEELRREFVIYGEVTSVTVMNDQYIGSGQPRGYGFVEMASKSESQAAIMNLDGKKIGDRVITVIEALPLSDNRGTGALPGNRASRTNGRVRQRKY